MKTPTPMTKSPRAVAQEALRLAQESLPPYSATRSRKDFTQHQHGASAPHRKGRGKKGAV
jgi:hypothetical protein